LLRDRPALVAADGHRIVGIRHRVAIRRQLALVVPGSADRETEAARRRGYTPGLPRM
jgi:hypothetical protein